VVPGTGGVSSGPSGTSGSSRRACCFSSHQMPPKTGAKRARSSDETEDEEVTKFTDTEHILRVLSDRIKAGVKNLTGKCKHDRFNPTDYHKQIWNLHRDTAGENVERPVRAPLARNVPLISDARLLAAEYARRVADPLETPDSRKEWVDGTVLDEEGRQDFLDDLKTEIKSKTARREKPNIESRALDAAKLLCCPYTLVAGRDNESWLALRSLVSLDAVVALLQALLVRIPKGPGGDAKAQSLFHEQLHLRSALSRELLRSKAHFEVAYVSLRKPVETGPSGLLVCGLPCLETKLYRAAEAAQAAGAMFGNPPLLALPPEGTLQRLALDGVRRQWQQATPSSRPERVSAEEVRELGAKLDIAFPVQDVAGLQRWSLDLSK
jgi:hypothetical protein